LNGDRLIAGPFPMKETRRHKKYGNGDKAPLVLNLTCYGDQWSALCSGHFTPRKDCPVPIR